MRGIVLKINTSMGLQAFPLLVAAQLDQKEQLTFEKVQAAV